MFYLKIADLYVETEWIDQRNYFLLRNNHNLMIVLITSFVVLYYVWNQVFIRPTQTKKKTQTWNGS